MFRSILETRWISWVGFRYLKSKKNSRFLSFITLISVLGVALGVTAMIVVLSVMDGFESELKKKLMATDLHVLVTPGADVKGFDRGLVPESALGEMSSQIPKLPGMLAFWPVVSTEAILKSGKKIAGVVVKGVTAERLTRLKAQVVEAAESHMLVQHEDGQTVKLPGLFIGQELANEMNLIPGDQLTLISPTETEGPLGSVPRLKRFVVEGIYKSGFPDQELHTVFGTESAIRSFLRRADVLSFWEITAKDFEHASRIAREIRRSLPPTFQVRDWEQMNAHLFASLKLERLAMFVILAFIIVVASFNIVTTLTLMVLEKKRDISILKAMGTRDSEIAGIFLAEGLWIGGAGIGLGVFLGFFLCSILKRYEFITLPEIYIDRTLPVTFEPLYYVLIPICALIIVLIACVYPSKRAARLNPMDGIRFG